MYTHVPVREATMPKCALLFFQSIIAIACVAGLAACGSNNTVVCPLTSNGVSACGCGANSASTACRAPAFVYADGLNQQVFIFPVDLTTNQLQTPTSVSGPSESLGMAAISNQFLYASAPGGAGGTASVDAWSINQTTGALTAVPGSPFSLGPLSFATGLAADNTTGTLYVADVARIDVLKADNTTGALTAIAGSPFTAEGAGLFLAIDPLDHFLFATGSSQSGNVLAYAVDATSGALTPVPGSPFPTNFNSSLETGIAVDALSKFVYVLSEGSNQVAGFSIGSNGALTAVPGSPFLTGNMPIGLIALQNFVYVSNAGDGTVSCYSINSTTGGLAPCSGSPFAIQAGSLTTGFGTFLYSSGAGGMMTFSIDSSSGGLTQLGTTIPFPGATMLTYVQ